jgi:hypothetical protein
LADGFNPGAIRRAYNHGAIIIGHGFRDHPPHAARGTGQSKSNR